MFTGTLRLKMSPLQITFPHHQLAVKLFIKIPSHERETFDQAIFLVNYIKLVVVASSPLLKAEFTL